jgi:tetratricopeptide (TPR) repeat protein
LALVLNQPALQSEAETMLRELVGERRDDRQALSLLALTLGRQGKREEAGDLFLRARNFSGAAWQYLAADRIDQAEDAARQAVLAEPSTGNLETLAEIESRGRQDLDAAQAALDRIPLAEAINDHPATTKFYLRMLRREPARALEALQPVPRDWLASSAYTGPKALLTGRAHALAGRLEAAKADWRAALAMVEKKLAAKENAPELLRLKAELLARLGEVEEGRRVVLVERQLSGLEADDFRGIAPIALRLGWTDEVLVSLERALRPDDFPGDYRNLHLSLRHSSDYDSLRGNPRFEKLLRDRLPPGAKPFDEPKLEAKK